MKNRDSKAPTIGERIIQFIGDVMMVEGYKYFGSRREWEEWCDWFQSELDTVKANWRGRVCRRPQG